MSKIIEVLRLKYLGKLSSRNIELLSIASKSAISNFTARFEKSGDINDTLLMDNNALTALLLPELKQHKASSDKPHPECLRGSSWPGLMAPTQKYSLEYQSTAY